MPPDPGQKGVAQKMVLFQKNPLTVETLMKVLIAIDGSDSSLRATQYVLDHAVIFGVKPDITLIYVHLPVPSPRARAWLGQEVLDQYYSEEAEEALAGATQLRSTVHSWTR